MRRLALSTAAAAIAMSLGAAQADTNSDASQRTTLFEKIDQNDNQLVTREEFVDYATEERGLEPIAAQALFNEIITPEPVVTVVMFREADGLRDWDGNDASGQQNASASTSNPRANANRNEAPMQREAMNDDMNNSENTSNARNANFAAMDDNDDGYVSKSEFTSFIAAPSNVNKKEARKLFDAAAGDDDRLTLAEFVSESDRIDRVSNNIVESSDKNDKSVDRSYNKKQKQADASSALSESVSRHNQTKTTASSFDEIDQNNNDRISRSEFLDYEREQAREAFNKISGDDNSITRAELRRADGMRKAALD
jgi:Ca2+-binding EF-hand superfamily protein